MRWLLVSVAAVLLALPASGAGNTRMGLARTVCDEPAARATLDQYLRAFNRGDFAALETLFAQAPTFVWYTVAPPKGRSSAGPNGRASLIAYFQARHARGEKLGLLRFRYGGTQQRDGAIQAGFSGYLSRRAGDLRPSRRGFKAVLRCTPEDREIIVVSIGGPLR